ncbi:putative small ubiquitin-related modifier 8 [Apium graveolens]|uniref:putative small ubiquitin-related modifier 8 n=1 Tax=Apium graveolens TaxID=4045 RepID=UPI003D7A4BF0
MDKMCESSSPRGNQLGKRPASSLSAQNRRGKKRAAEKDEELHGFILITVKSQKKEVCFKIQRTIKLQKIIKVFCDKAGLKFSTMQFLVNGSRIPLTSTADELGMSDGAEIEAMALRRRGGKAAGVI